MLIAIIILSGTSELSLGISNSSPVFNNLFLLSSHLDKESSVKDFLIKLVSNKVNGINSHFEDDFKRSRVVILDFDEVKFREGFLDIFFSGVEITLDKIESDMLNILIKKED